MEQKEYNLKEREQNLNFWKFVLGTVILGLSAQGINLYIQKSRIDFEIRKEETVGLQNFLDRYTSIEKPERKLDFLKFMSTISQSLEIRMRYETLHEFVEKQIETKKQDILKIDEISKGIPEKVEELKQMEKIIFTGESDGQITVEEAKERLDNLLEDNEIQKASSLSEDIKETENKISPLDKNNIKLAGTESQEVLISETDQWLKEGYFRPYNNYFIGVNDLNVKGEKAQFQLRKSKTTNEDVLRNFELKIGDQMIIKTDNISVVIKLNDIGGAGKNPFTKAAIYDIRILKNNS